MRLLGSCDIKAGSLTLNIEKGSYSALVFQIDGTNATSQTMAVSDIGNIRILRGGMEKANIDFQDLVNINDAEGGLNDNASTVSSTFKFQARYSFRLPKDSANTVKFENSDGQLIVNFASTIATKVSSGSFAVYGKVSKGIESYFPCWKNYSQQLGTTGQIATANLIEKNVDRLYFRTATDFTNLLVSKDDLNIVNASKNALLADMLYNYFCEAVKTFVIIDLNPSRSIAEISANKIFLQITSGLGSAGSTALFYCNVEFNSERTQVSVQSFKKYQNQALQSSPQASAVQGILVSNLDATSAKTEVN